MGQKANQTASEAASNGVATETGEGFQDGARKAGVSKEKLREAEKRIRSVQWDDAGALHNLGKELLVLGNQARQGLIDVLRILNDTKGYKELGYAAFHSYCMREFGVRKSTAYEYVRVSRALENLPLSRVLHWEGDVSWQQVREFTKVATPATEAQWLQLSAELPLRQLIAEVKAAVKAGLDAPRDRRTGLPNLTVKMILDLTLEEKERIRLGLALAAHEMSGGSGSRKDDVQSGERSSDDDSGGSDGGDPEGDPETGPESGHDLKSALLSIVDGLLSGELRIANAKEGCVCGNPIQSESSIRLVYHDHPTQGPTVDTPDGRVSVTKERIEEVASVAEVVTVSASDAKVERMPPGEVDKPTSAKLRREVFSRDGMRCTDPDCDRVHGLNAHHIDYLSQGGPTVADNLTTTCDTTHSLIHYDVLDVEGTAPNDLVWTRRPRNPDAVLKSAAKMAARLAELAESLPKVSDLAELPRERPYVPGQATKVSTKVSTSADTSLFHQSGSDTTSTFDMPFDGIIRRPQNRIDIKKYVEERILAPEREAERPNGDDGPTAAVDVPDAETTPDTERPPDTENPPDDETATDVENPTDAETVVDVENVSSGVIRPEAADAERTDADSRLESYYDLLPDDEIVIEGAPLFTVGEITALIDEMEPPPVRRTTGERRMSTSADADEVSTSVDTDKMSTSVDTDKMSTSADADEVSTSVDTAATESEVDGISLSAKGRCELVRLARESMSRAVGSIRLEELAVALTSLGWGRRECERRVLRAIGELTFAAGFFHATGSVPARPQSWTDGTPEMPDPGSDEQVLRRAIMMR